MSDFSIVTELKGLALPAQKGPGGYFETKSSLDVAWGDLMLTLFTPVGSRPMNREFGSVLHQQLFEPIDAVLDEGILEYVIREAVDIYAPHIEIREVVALDAPPKQARVAIKFALRTDAANEATREVQIDRSFVSAGGN